MTVKIKYYSFNEGLRESQAETPAHFCLENLGARPFSVHEGFQPASENEITKNFSKMISTTGEFTIVETPASFLGFVVAFISLVSAAITIFARQPQPVFKNVNRQQKSPNNALSDRSNTARINERIPDIGGQVNSIPDIIMSSYRKFFSNIEEEVSYYCIGRKSLLIENIKDGDTLISDITNASAAVYGPFTSPNSGDSPEIQIGPVISDPIQTVRLSVEVGGLILRASNESLPAEDTDIIPNDIGKNLIIPTDRDYFEVNSSGVGRNRINTMIVANERNFTLFFKDDFEISAVLGVTLNTPIFGDHFPFFDPHYKLSIGDIIECRATSANRVTGEVTFASGGRFTDWFSLSTLKVDRFWVNVVAARGMFKDDGVNRTSTSVNFNLEWQFLDDNKTPVGSISSSSGTVSGGDTDQKGTTVEIAMGSRSYIRCRIQRTTLKDVFFNGTVVDEIQWRDLYGSQDVELTDFGDVTTMHTRRIRNETSTSIKTPVLSCLATEKVDKYLGDGLFAGSLTPNTQAMQTLIRMALDPKIGGRDVTELDLDQLLQAQEDIEGYFDAPESGEFSYTFDSTQITPQEIFYAIANSVFSIPYRTGKVLQVEFEQPQAGPAMVFTHRSKKPGVEKWSRRFRNSSENDGVILKWQNRETSTQEVIFFPADRSAINPRTYEIPGIANFQQAHWRAWREFQKIRYGRIGIDVTTTAEGRFIKPSRMISVVKGSRVHTFDGYVRSVDGLEIQLSQSVEFIPGDDHFIILKKRNGDIQSIPVITGIDDKHVVLLEVPEEAIYTDNSALKTEFSFGPEMRLEAQRILPLTIDPSGKQYVRVTGVNYDERYYSFDTVNPLGKAHSTGFDEGFS